MTSPDVASLTLANEWLARNRSGRSRLYLLAFDPQSGALKIDGSFRDNDGKAGFSFENRTWPQGWKGSGWPHGAVFSR